MIYAVSFHFIIAAFGFFLLTFAYTLANIGFLTYFQKSIPTEILGRFTSVFTIFESGAGILAIGVVGGLTNVIEMRGIVIAISFVFLIISGLNFMRISKNAGTIG